MAQLGLNPDFLHIYPQARVLPSAQTLPQPTVAECPHDGLSGLEKTDKKQSDSESFVLQSPFPALGVGLPKPSLPSPASAWDQQWSLPVTPTVRGLGQRGPDWRSLQTHSQDLGHPVPGL